MSETVKPLRFALLVACFLVLALAAASRPTSAADLPLPLPETVTSLTTEAYLDRYTDLLLLRARFAAILKTDIPGLLSQQAQTIGIARPTPQQIEDLRNDLTAEIHYYAINLRYLIWADGAIWPEDKPAQTYRSDALAEISAIIGEMAEGDALALDAKALLERLEQVSAWTEGLAMPAEDWFGGDERQTLVEDAEQAVNAPVHT